MCSSSSSLQFSIFQGRTMGRKLVLVKSVGHLGTSTRAPMALCVVPGVLMVKTGMAQPRGIASLTQNIQRGKSVITTSRWPRESFIGSRYIELISPMWLVIFISKLSFQGWSVRLWSDLLQWTLYFWKLSTSNTKYKSKSNFLVNYYYFIIIFLDPSCVDTGLVGFNLCYNGTTNENLGQCCPDYYSGSTQVYCLPTEDTPATQDR